MRVGYLCMQSEFSTKPLAALLDRGVDVRFVMRPLPREHRRAVTLLRETRSSAELGTSAVGPRADPLALAERAGIPRFLVGDASSALVTGLLAKERVDVLVVVFFNQLLRPEVFEPLPLGAINAHPSLLPRYRGPAPLFWTFKDGATESGVTIHRVARGEDDGDVIVQSPEPVGFGMRGEALVEVLGAHAARGIVEALGKLGSGTLTTKAQDAAEATRAPRPSREHLVVDPSLPARRVFAFVRGVGRWNALTFTAGGETLRVVDALDLDEEGRMPGDWALQRDVLLLRCAPGVVALKTRALRV